MPGAKPSSSDALISLLGFWHLIYKDAFKESIFSSSFVGEETDIKWLV